MPRSRTDQVPPFERRYPVANIRSQIKRNRQNEKRRVRNRSVRSQLNTRTKAAVTAATEGSDDTEAVTRDAISRLDRAASSGVIHKNAAARKKSRLMKQIARIEAGD